MTPSQLHEYLSGRIPIDQVPIDWDSSGYNSEVFNRWAGAQDFPGWKGDLPAEDEAQVIVGLLETKRGDSVLDVACGYGRHAVVMASRHGLRVTGVDTSSGIITSARRKAAENGLSINYHVQDARELRWTDEFDGAMIALNSFSLFSSTDSRRVLEGIRRGLRPGARLFLDLDNKPFARRYGTSTNDWYLSPGGLTLQETYFHEDESVEVTRDLNITNDEAEVEEFMNFMLLYSCGEICDVLEACGFHVEQTYGGWDLSPLGEDSPKILLVGSNAE